MNPRGRVLGIGAYARGRKWRACLRRIRTADPVAIQTQELGILISHALRHVPYYRGLRLPEETIDGFPLLTRATLRSQYEHLISDDLQARRWLKVFSGGSTGEPIAALVDRAMLHWERATELYAVQTFFGMSPIDYLSSRRVMIWHRDRVLFSSNPWLRLAARALNQVIHVEPYEIITDEKMNEDVQRINHHRPDVIFAFAGTLFAIAKHIQRLNIGVHRPRFIMTTGEMLYPAMRRTIQDVFGSPVYSRYGAAETGDIASECSYGKFHVFSFKSYVEVLDDNGHATKPGEVGRVVATPLHSLAMPLIRYEIGDLARVSGEPCRCGNPLPTWDGIAGRVVHHFVRADGGLVRGGNFIAMFYEHDWVLQFHMLQEDVDRIVISYKRVPGRSVHGGDIGQMTRVIQDAMGRGCTIIWREVDVVPHSPIGKHLHVRSLVWEEQSGIAPSSHGTTEIGCDLTP
jgi:phenylacetate-CoA ligase